MKLSTRHSHWLEISVSREGVSNVVVGIGGVEGAWGEKKRKKEKNWRRRHSSHRTNCAYREVISNVVPKI